MSHLVSLKFCFSFVFLLFILVSVFTCKEVQTMDILPAELNSLVFIFYSVVYAISKWDTSGA